MIHDCQKCEISSHRKNVVISEGYGTDILFISDTPRYLDNKTGTPFSGLTGNIFKKILSKVGILNMSYFTLITHCYPNNREPSEIEIKNCLPYLIREIEEIKPKVIVLLGGIALRIFWGKKFWTLNEKRSKLMVNNNRVIIATYSPYYIVKPGSNLILTQFVEDMLLVKKVINQWNKIKHQ